VWYRYSFSQDWAEKVLLSLKADDENAIAQATYNRFTKKQELPSSLDNLKEWRNLYLESFNKLENLLKNNWDHKGNPAWLQFSLKNKTKLPDQSNYKVYFTVKNPLQQFEKFMQTLYILANNLNSIPTNYNLSFKVPSTSLGAHTHTDTIVVHFGDPNIKDQVEQAILSAASTTGLESGSREDFYRTTQGRDTKDGSDTEILSKRFARNVLANKDYLLSLENDKTQLLNTLLSIWQTISTEGLHR
jgi:hypothetical protein